MALWKWRHQILEWAFLLGKAYHGRDVIARGLCWRIGNGRTVKIWLQHWLPTKHLTLVFSPILDSLKEATIDLLIDSLTDNGTQN